MVYNLLQSRIHGPMSCAGWRRRDGLLPLLSLANRAPASLVQQKGFNLRFKNPKNAEAGTLMHPSDLWNL